MANPISSNLELKAALALDDREGVLDSGVWRAYNSKTEATNSTINVRYNGLEVLIRTETSVGVFRDLKYRWEASDWVLADAIQLQNNSLPTPSNESFIII